MPSTHPSRLSIFHIPEFRTIAVAMLTAGAISVASAFVSSRGDAQVAAERISTTSHRVDLLESVTRDLAQSQASQAQSAASVAATQQAMAAMLARHDQDLRDLRVLPRVNR